MHQYGLSRNPAAMLYDTLETQSARQRAQRRQGRVGRESAGGLPYGGSQLYGRASLKTVADTLCEMGSKLPQFSTTGRSPTYKAYFTYLNYEVRIQSIIYTMNRIERLQKDFRRAPRIREAMPNDVSVLLLMGKTAMDKKSYLRPVPRIDLDRDLFPE